MPSPVLSGVDDGNRLRTLLDRSSIYGEVRWPRAIGKVRSGPAEFGLRISYLFTPKFGFLMVRHPRTWEDSTTDEYVVRYWGPGIVEPEASVHGVVVELAPAVPWEAPGADFRYVDRPLTLIDVTRPSIYVVETVHVVGRRFDTSAYRPFDPALVVAPAGG